MATTADKLLQNQFTPGPDSATPIIVPASILWNLLIAAGCIFLSIHIFGLDDFGRLGRPVQYFAGVVVILPALMAVASSIMLYQRKAMGRYLALIIQYVGTVLCIVGVLHLWGVFLSFEAFVDSVMTNAPLTLGFAAGYGLYWLGGRLGETNPWRDRLTQVALLIASATLIILLLATDVLGTANYILNTYNNTLTWVLTAGAVIFGVLTWQMLHLGAYFGELPTQRDAWQGWLMLSPNIIGFMFFFAGPLLLSFYFSFTNGQIGRVPEVIGVSNYTHMLSVEFQWRESAEVTRQSVLSRGYSPLMTVNVGERELIVGARDVMFWRSMRNTIFFCMMLVPLSAIPALILSLILNSKLPGVKFFRALYFLPSVAAVVGTALIWRWLYDPTIGFFNYIITTVTGFLGLADPQVAWLTGPGVVLISIVLLAAWQLVGFNTVLFLAGLQGIPHVLYEAAQIDGANRWQQFRNVTLPMLAPTSFFVIVTTIITGLQVFNEPYALFPARPIPVEATTAVYYLYDRAFPGFQYGYASAVAWVLFALIFMVTFIQFRLQRSEAYEN